MKTIEAEVVGDAINVPGVKLPGVVIRSADINELRGCDEQGRSGVTSRIQQWAATRNTATGSLTEEIMNAIVGTEKRSK